MADLATIARPYAEALFQSTKPAELAVCLEQLNELAQLAVLPEVAVLSNNPKVSADDLSKLLSGMVKTKLDGKTASKCPTAGPSCCRFTATTAGYRA